MKMNTLVKIIPFIVVCFGCNETEEKPAIERSISGRNVLIPIYVSMSPSTWKSDTSINHNRLENTTLPIAKFIITDDKGTITVVVHNFPSNHIGERISPAAQVKRWRQQLEHPEAAEIIPVAWSGFSGLYFSGKGVMGWAMQIHQDHYSSLMMARSPEEEGIYREMRADYTIKATGPEELLDKYREEIHFFASSFELKHDINAF